MMVSKAIERARSVRAGEAAPAPAVRQAARVVAIGDPQASAARFLGALAAHHLLGDDGWLRPDVRLISMGDHFDYPGEDAAGEGVLILGWLAAHAREHVAILFGNHDASRVMELATIDDVRFRAAAELARSIKNAPDRQARKAEFRRLYPELATPGYAARDYSAFTVEQRRLVQRMLLDGRFELALARKLAGTPVLLSHAGITTVQLGLLELGEERSPSTIASALNARLGAAVDAVRTAWTTGTNTALSLEPIHMAGMDGEEGGGLLYHRPADKDRPGADPAWELRELGPRRFDPRQLPRGLVQIVGHTGHKKAHEELERWCEPGMTADRGGVRTLRVSGADTVSYRRGVYAPADGDAVVYLIDPEMHYVAAPTDVAVLELATG
jgi:hypothetical protein